MSHADMKYPDGHATSAVLYPPGTWGLAKSEDPAMAIMAYLAGPDVFLPHARDHARRKIAICARHGIIARAPLDEDTCPKPLSSEEAWQAIFRANIRMMRDCDIVVANLTPFRGASADAGTLVEIGWFLGQGKPVFGYSNSAVCFSERSRRHVHARPDPIAGLVIEEFGLPDNLMIQGAALAGEGHPIVLPADGQNRAFDALDVFERCVQIAAHDPRPAFADNLSVCG